jgi:hypothetical protein
MSQFRDFFESTPVDMARSIRKNWGKSYRPGTFGIEIEWAAEETTEYDQEEEFDSSSAWEAFREENIDEVPQKLDDWLEDNEEPEKPDPKDYKWDEDPLVNAWLLNMEREPMHKPLPDAARKYSDLQIKELFHDLPSKPVEHMMETINQIIHTVNRLYEGKGVPSHTSSTGSWWMLSSTKSLQNFVEKSKAGYNIGASRFEQELRGKFSLPELQFSRTQIRYLDELNDSITEAVKEFAEHHMERAKGIDRAEFEEQKKEEFESDMETWQEEHETWQTEHDEVEEAWNNYDENERFERWLDERPSLRMYRGNYASNRDRFTTTQEREGEPHANVIAEVEEAQEWLRSQGKDVRSKDGWNVHPDEEGIAEISSPILTTKDFGFLKELLEYLRYKDFNSSTGLHVHIGMPQITDAFDLLAVAYTIDEEAVLVIAGRTESSLSNYADKKNNLFKSLYSNLSEGLIPVQQFQTTLDSVLDRYWGVNTIKAFKKFGTVEMRYLSSQIVEERDGAEKLFKFINYFLMLPKIAQGRSQIRYNVPGVGSIIFSRRPGGKVEIKKFPLNQPGRVPMAGQPVADLRQPQQPDLRNRLQQKFGLKPKPDSAIAS